MAILQIRDLPDDIYEKLKAEAAREHRSLAQQAVAMLERALAPLPSPKARRQELVKEILARDVPVTPGLDPVKAVREDRDR